MSSETAGEAAWRYLIAVWTVGLAFVATLLLSSFVTPRVSPLFLLAVMVSAWRGGLVAGLLATALSALVNVYVLLPPAFSFHAEREDLLQLAVFICAAVIVGTLSAARRRAESEREALLLRERAARAEAERANATKDEFLAAVSHELRTPLTTIKALTRILLRKNPTEDARRDYLEDIASECDRQIDLVHNLLDLSRIRAGGVEIVPRRVDAAEILRACVKIERIEAAEHGHQLSVETARDLPDIRADHSALRRALCAVVENSIKYTPAGGRIQLSAGPDGRDVAIRVEDNGRGIHPDDLPHVFDSFYRGKAAGEGADDNGADSQEVPGIGLGLHLARSLVEGMNGSIEVRSEPGRGSIFTLRLPAWDGGNGDRETGVGSVDGATGPAAGGRAGREE
ncbi:MAG TPA: HAMP domain-containing sensor histidine kinase [Pyrinomonadaceae bacterium]|nr:HAMP domain-containing sensor histidine kinase [Pyrinomonadaceae bacterium]